MYVVCVDRIEEGYAILLRDDSTYRVALSVLPEGTREGSVLRVEDGAYQLDILEEQRLRSAAKEKLRRVFDD